MDLTMIKPPVGFKPKEGKTAQKTQKKKKEKQARRGVVICVSCASPLCIYATAVVAL
jgi:hypothetical protein